MFLLLFLGVGQLGSKRKGPGGDGIGDDGGQWVGVGTGGWFFGWSTNFISVAFRPSAWKVPHRGCMTSGLSGFVVPSDGGFSGHTLTTSDETAKRGCPCVSALPHRARERLHAVGHLLPGLDETGRGLCSVFSWFAGRDGRRETGRGCWVVADQLRGPGGVRYPGTPSTLGWGDGTG